MKNNLEDVCKTFNFSGSAIWNSPLELPDIEENEEIPMCFILNGTKTVFLNGIYTVLEGKKVFIGFYQGLTFSYSEDGKGLKANITTIRKVFAFEEVKHWTILTASQSR